MQPPKKSFIVHLGNLFLLKEASIKAIKQNKDYNRFGILLFIVAFFLMMVHSSILSVGGVFEFMQKLDLKFIFLITFLAFLDTLLYMYILHYIGTTFFSAKVGFLVFLKPMSAVIVYSLLFTLIISFATTTIVPILIFLVWSVVASIRVYNIVYEVKTGNAMVAYLISILAIYLINLILTPLIGFIFWILLIWQGGGLSI